MFHNIRFMPSTLIASLENEVAKGHFSCWSYGNRHIKVSGFSALEQLSQCHPRFDLASLTKPLFMANLIFMRLASKLLTTPLPINANGKWAEPLTCFANHRPDLCILDLINHRSGLPPWTWFGLGLHDATSTNGFSEEHLLRHIVTLSGLRSDTLYSDLNYYLLAKILENQSEKQSESRHWNSEMNALNLANGTNFYHASVNPAPFSVAYYPFEYSNDKENSFGNVHDTNANILAEHNKISGHAGLFGTLTDVQNAFVNHVENVLSLPQTEKHTLGARFFYGLDTPTGNLSSAGSANADQFLGHLGYTGTSAWYNRASQNHCVLLTNRTACDMTKYARDGNQKSLRMISVTSNEGQCFFEVKPDRLAPCQFDFHHQGKPNIFHRWDKSVLRVPPDISGIRRSAAIDTWSLDT